MLPAFLSHVRIRPGELPERLEGATAGGVLWQAGDGRFQLNVPDVARFRVERDCTVRIHEDPGCGPGQVARFMGMAPMAALVFQRGGLAYRAAAAANAQGAVLLAGGAGAGKSTLLAALVQRGWRMLADDLAAVEESHGELAVQPCSSVLAIWPGALARLGLQRRVVAVVPGFPAALAVARGSDLIALVPASYALRQLESPHQAGTAALHCFDLPVAVEGITVSQMWHPRLHTDAGHRWLRELVLGQCRQLTAQ